MRTIKVADSLYAGGTNGSDTFYNVYSPFPLFEQKWSSTLTIKYKRFQFRQLQLMAF